MRFSRTSCRLPVLLALTLPLWLPPLGGNVISATDRQAPAPSGLELRKGDTIAIVGNTFAERLQHFNHFETMLMTRFPELHLRVRNLAWSGDTITLQPRPLNFGDAAKHLTEQKADVVLACFGLNESFDGEAGLARFEKDLDAYLQSHASARYNGTGAPRLALVSPIAHERLRRLPQVEVDGRNREVERYTGAMRRVAAARQVVFVDLFTPTKRLMNANPGAPALTINGIHLNNEGDRLVAGLLMEGLGFEPRQMKEATGAGLKALESLRDAIREKNLQFFYRWRPVNAEYVVGRRVEPFGSISFPPEMRQLDEIVSELDQRSWKRGLVAAGLRYALAPAGQK
jgi:lysophospholipase L1-like esterase